MGRYKQYEFYVQKHDSYKITTVYKGKVFYKTDVINLHKIGAKYYRNPDENTYLNAVSLSP